VTTQTEARDIVSARLHTAWLADPLSAPITLLWSKTVGDKAPEHDGNGNPAPFARVAVIHSSGVQDTLNAPGSRRYLTGGLVQVQIFTPAGDGSTLGDQLVEIVKAALRSTGTTSAVWFLDITPNDLGRDGPWDMQTVEARFRYQELG
jgi:hypothetical protein